MRKSAVQIPVGELADTLVEFKVLPVRQLTSKSPREQRKAALSKVFGIFKGRDDAPQDGLAFQLDMRTE